MYLLHASFHRRFGCPLLLFPGMSTSNILLSMFSTFILLTCPYHYTRFSVIFLHACTTPVVPIMCSFRILSILVTPHIYLCILISFISCFLSSRCCPCLCTIQKSWSDHSVVNLPPQLHWHLPVIQHSIASLPVSPCCTHSLLNVCCHASCLFQACTEILKRCTRCSSSPGILTGSLPWLLSCPNLKSMN